MYAARVALPQVMMAVGACSALGSPVIGCYMNPDKRFAFVEFRSVEEASNAMAFDGVTCQVSFLLIETSVTPVA
jgi:splicing factor U2AF subunit